MRISAKSNFFDNDFQSFKIMGAKPVAILVQHHSKLHSDEAPSLRPRDHWLKHASGLSIHYCL